MELEHVKAAWQREKSIYPLRDTKQMAAETKRRAMKMDQEFVRQQALRIACGLLSLAWLASQYDSRHPLLANAGLLVLTVALALMLAGSVSLRFRLRTSHPEWPDGKYLAEQRERISARITLVRRNMTWLFPPSLLGFLLWQIGLSHSIRMTVVIVIVVVIAFLGTIWWGRQMLRKDLLPMLKAIDQELADLKRGPVSGED